MIRDSMTLLEAALYTWLLAQLHYGEPYSLEKEGPRSDRDRVALFIRSMSILRVPTFNTNSMRSTLISPVLPKKHSNIMTVR